MNYTFAQYQESADYIRSQIGGFAPKVAMILGSGLGYMGDIVENPIAVPYQNIPHFKVSTAPATRVSWCSAPWRGRRWLLCRAVCTTTRATPMRRCPTRCGCSACWAAIP